MNHREWERLARRVKKESPDLFVDTEDWYVRRKTKSSRLSGHALSCIDPKTGEHFIFWSPQDWDIKRAERGC